MAFSGDGSAVMDSYALSFQAVIGVLFAIILTRLCPLLSGVWRDRMLMKMLEKSGMVSSKSLVAL